MAGIKVSVKFDNIKKLQDNLSKQEVHATIDDTMKEISEIWANDVHVITGHLQSTIGYETSGYVGKVFATAEYAAIERARPGGKDGTPHDFTIRGTEQGTPIFIQRLQELVKL
jgi:hypothetical protein